MEAADSEAKSLIVVAGLHGLRHLWKLQKRSAKPEWRMEAAGKPLLSFEGWQMAALSLPRPEWRMGAAGKPLAGFEGWQTAPLNPRKRKMPRPEALVEAAKKSAAA